MGPIRTALCGDLSGIGHRDVNVLFSNVDFRVAAKILKIDPIGVWTTTYATSTRPFHPRREPDYLTTCFGFVECCSAVSFQHVRHIILTGSFKTHLILHTIRNSL